MTLSLYLIREICKPLAVILGVLAALFASYSASGFLSDAVNGLLPSDMIAQLIGLKALISFEVLIPISLYLAVVMSFGRLYSDSEFTAMYALRVTPTRVILIVLALSACLAVIVGGLSLYARPWAYERSHELSRQAETLLDVDYMEAGTFYTSQNGNRAIFIEQRERPTLPAHNVFVRFRHEDRIQIIYAHEAYQRPSTAPNSDTEVYFSGVHGYEFGGTDDTNDHILKTKEIVLPISKNIAPPEYNAVAASTASLAVSDVPKDIAELQWRLSTPVSTLLLGMLGVPISRARPRQSKYAKFGSAILIYSGYYLVCTSARTWVQNGAVPPFPGIWWAPALLALALALILAWPGLAQRFKRRRSFA